MNVHDTGIAGQPCQEDAPQTRASDADRDRAAGLINAAYAEGRMDADERSGRVNAAYAARTWDQLRRLTADLPAEGTAHALNPATPARSFELERCLQCALMVACPPLGFAWWYLSRRRTACSAGDTGATLGANHRPALR